MIVDYRLGFVGLPLRIPCLEVEVGVPLQTVMVVPLAYKLDGGLAFIPHRNTFVVTATMNAGSVVAQDVGASE